MTTNKAVTDRETRMRFMEVSETTGEALRDFWKVLEPHLPVILDGFAHLGSTRAGQGDEAPAEAQVPLGGFAPF